MLSILAVILPFLFAVSGVETGVLIAEGILVVGAGAAIGVLENKIRKKTKSDADSGSADIDNPDENISEGVTVSNDENVNTVKNEGNPDFAKQDETEETTTEQAEERVVEDVSESENENTETSEDTAENTDKDSEINKETAEENYSAEILPDGSENEADRDETDFESLSHDNVSENEQFDSDASELKAFVAACSAERLSDETEEQPEENISPAFDAYEKVEESDENNAGSFSKYNSNETNELRRHIHESMAATRITSQNVEKYNWDKIKEYNTAIMPIATFGRSDGEDDGDDEKPGGARIADDIIFSNGTDIMNVRYRKSFKAKLIQSDDIVKDYYLIVRAALFRYEKVRVQECFARENYYAGRLNIAKMSIRGKTLVLYLALNPTEYAGQKYRFRNLSDKKQYTKTPLMLKITSTRSARWACELIDTMLKGRKEKKGYEPDHSAIPFERTSLLMKRNLVRAYTPDGQIELTEYMLTQLENIDGKGRTVSTYKQSFAAKIIRSDKTLQNYYSDIKNELLSYKNVKARSSWNAESFYLGRTTKAKLTLRGKTLTLFLALDPKDYVGTKYHARDFSDRKKYAATPVAVKIKSQRGLKFAYELVARVFAGCQKTEAIKIDYTSDFKDTGALLREGLVKKIK